MALKIVKETFSLSGRSRDTHSQDSRLKTEEDHNTMQSIFYLEMLKINKDQPRYFLQYQYPYVYFILPNTFIRNWSRKVDLASGGCRTEDWLVYFIFLSSYTRTGSLVITGPETTKSSSN